MNQPLLTVIVPCYNAEKYMDKCISSIANQTYPNLEILLINDGSVDQTGKLCDTWQAKDGRIRVIHKQNEGASYARKTGVENATAEYITFVDADDCIDANMYTDMMIALLSTGSDIADSDFCLVYEDGHVEHRVQERNLTIKTMGRVEGIIMILENHQWRTSLVTKIFKKNLFDHVEFPKGRVFGEDMIVQYLFHHASQSVFLNCEYYFYCIRSDSASNRQGDIIKTLKNLSDLSDAYYECYSFVKQYPEYHRALPLVKRMTARLGMRLLHNIIEYPQYLSNEFFRIKAEQLRSIPFRQEDRLRRGLEIELYILNISPKLYRILRTLYVRTIRMTNRLKITDKYPSTLSVEANDVHNIRTK